MKTTNCVRCLTLGRPAFPEIEATWSGEEFPLTQHVCKTARHTSFYLACGASDAPPMIFVHLAGAFA